MLKNLQVKFLLSYTVFDGALMNHDYSAKPVEAYFLSKLGLRQFTQN